MHTVMPVHLKQTSERERVSRHKVQIVLAHPRYTITTPKAGAGKQCCDELTPCSHGQIEKQPCNTDIGCPSECTRKFEYIINMQSIVRAGGVR